MLEALPVSTSVSWDKSKRPARGQADTGPSTPVTNQDGHAPPRAGPTVALSQ